MIWKKKTPKNGYKTKNNIENTTSKTKYRPIRTHQKQKRILEISGVSDDYTNHALHVALHVAKVVLLMKITQ